MKRRSIIWWAVLIVTSCQLVVGQEIEPIAVGYFEAKADELQTSELESDVSRDADLQSGESRMLEGRKRANDLASEAINDLHLSNAFTAVGASGGVAGFASIESVAVRSLMANEARRNLGKPERRVYVQYKGIRYPLKGWALVENRDVSTGARIFDSISPDEQFQVQDELLELKQTRLALKTRADDLQDKVQSSDRTIKARAISIGGTFDVTTDDQMLGLMAERANLNEMRNATALRMSQVNARINELTLLRARGRPQLVAMRVDEYEPGFGTPGFQRSQSAVQTQATIGGTRSIGGVNSNSPVSDSSIVQRGGFDFKRPKFSLPAPDNPNDLFYSPQTNSNATRMGLARMVRTDLFAEVIDFTDIFANVRVTPSFGAFYDTRTVESEDANSFNIGTIPTERLITDGQTTFVGSNDVNQVDLLAPTTVLVDTEVENAVVPLIMREGQLQFMLEANNFRRFDDLSLRHLYARVWNKGTLSVLGGKTQSLFSIRGLAPAALDPDSQLIGTSDLGNENRVQFRLQRNFASEGRGYAWGIGIEDPLFTDFAVAETIGTTLRRWPTIASNMTFVGQNQIDRIQFASLIRSFGMQRSSDNTERWKTAWGLSAFASKGLLIDCCSQTTIFLGVAGGEGVGNYINGVSTAAVFDSSTQSLTLLDGFGTYTGLKHHREMRNGWQLDANLAYGYATMNTIAGMDDDSNEHLHQAWVNMFVRPNEQLAIGLEWQHGRRLTRADGNGDNNRFFFGIQLTTKAPADAESDAMTVGASNLMTFNGRVVRSAQQLSRDSQLFNDRESRSSYAHLQSL
ncbi:MAG: hypothetical protein AAFX06_22930 [Planctomycetota bacterium]